MKTIRVAKDFIHGSLVNGEGIRTVIFFSGCDKNCKGCHNKDLQDFNAGIIRHVDDIINEILEEIDMIDGVTLSGGDPMCQRSGLFELCKGLKEHNINVWVYTGETYDELRGTHILKYIDVLVDGKFEESLKSEKIKYRGSSNQNIIYLNEDGIPTRIISGEENGYEK